MKGIYKSFKDASRGFIAVLREERNFKIEVFCAIVVIVFMIVFPLSYVEISLLVLMITIVLSAEIVNTTLEDLCDKVEPKFDPVVGKIKDMMAAFVLVSSLGALIVGIIIAIHYL
ncbi:MAG: diacylglycerol kinase family protein [Candidatus Taylorbacteria bacterium]|nr:diacylglycerol kinase family protein [Candidatus Taylorbacteria bacterium]